MVKQGYKVKKENQGFKETKEILKSLKADLKVKWESALLDARQSAMERVGSED